MEAQQLEKVTAYLGLGTNLGAREVNLKRAAHLLTAPGPLLDRNPPSLGDETRLAHLQLIRSSSIYETAPWGYVNQPRFLNCVLEVETGLSPSELLRFVQGLEAGMGREPSSRYGPRIIDLDILLYGDQTVQQPDLQIPHPRLHQRAFVLIPLAELAPDLVHPTLSITIGQLARDAQDQDGVMRIGPPLDPTTIPD
ncbi:MAG: 2-amino-4-hydroxy-6-hydroxymethyldihydropteridine diphosphokinase [Chloroflexi bacterium]|nr:2-amino-4-hydroxy-6-hydroxymethyldihydropteridine diphosphokinase [Chloroflexota bacterium]